MNTTATATTLTSYEQHLANVRAQQATDCAALREVATTGQAQGLWTIRKVYDEAGTDDRSPTNPGAWRYVDVTTPDGTPFDLTVNRHKGAKITARLGQLEAEGHRITTSDLAYDLRNMARPEATCAVSRGTAAILKDLTRRVIHHPNAVTMGQAMRDTLAQRLDRAQGLRAHMATLTAMGYDFRHVSDTENHQAKGYKCGAPQLTVYANGSVSFDASTTVANLPAVLAALGK